MSTMIEKASAEAATKAAAKTGQNMVLTVLRKKFKPVPKEIEDAVLAMTDPIALESMHEHAIDSNTLDEFAEVL